MKGGHCVGRVARCARGFALIAIAAGCQPLPATAPPAARWRAEPVCQVHRRYQGSNSVTDYDYQLAADGSTIEIDVAWSAGRYREVFIRDHRGQLLARERTGEEEDTPDFRIINPGPYATRITYRYDGKGRRASAEHVDLDVSRPRSAAKAATPSKRVRYQYEADRLVAIEWTGRSDPRVEVWRLVYEGPRLVQVRYEVDGRVSFLHDYQHDAAGRRIKDVSVSTGGYPMTYELRYDPAGRLIGRDLATHDQRLSQQRIEYDAAGRVERFHDHDFETRYAYDDAGRLVRNEHLAAMAMNQSTSELTYSDGCTVENTARLIPDPVSYFLDEMLGLEDERWIRVHPEWDGDTPWF